MDNTNPKDLIGETKPPLDLIPPAAEIAESLVMALGAKKYGRANWRSKRVRASIYVAAAKRHLAQWMDGQDDDEESGITHLAHVRACMGILIDAKEGGNLVDDRPDKGPAAEMLKRLAEKKGNTRVL